MGPDTLMFLTAVMDAMDPLKEALAATVELAKKLLDKLVDKLALCE